MNKQADPIHEHFSKLGKSSWEVRKQKILDGTIGNKKKKASRMAKNKDKIAEKSELSI